MLYLIGRHPFIKLEVKLPEKRWIEIDCLIDTGFSGGLVLPKKFKESFLEDEFIEARFVLANGSEIMAEASYTKVRYKKIEKEVAVVFMGDSEGLVGVEFLDQMKFCLDLKKNKVELFAYS